MNQQARNNAFWAGIAALLMLYFGWGVGLAGYTDSELYNTTVAVFDWMLKIGGIGMAGVAVICLAGQRVGLLIDAIVAGICGVIMVLCSIYWLLSGGFGINDLLFLVFGCTFLHAARGSWSSYTATASGASGPPAERRSWFPIKPLEPPKPPPKAEPPHPASIRPKSLPSGDEPPPEGYLAALAKEEDEPPSASHK